MKKALVYMLLGGFVVLPIALLLSMAVLSIPQNDYAGLEAVITEDYSIEILERGSIQEVIQMEGRLISGMEDIYSFNNEEMKVKVSCGSLVDEKTVLAESEKEKLIAEHAGIVEDITAYDGSLSIRIGRTQVRAAELSLPSDMYAGIASSSICYEDNDGSTAIGKLLEVEKIADENGYFKARYLVEKGEKYICNGILKVELTTGRSRKNTFIVPRSCLMEAEGGERYIEAVEEGNIERIRVSVGIEGEYYIEIFGEEGVLRPGMELISR